MLADCCQWILAHNTKEICSISLAFYISITAAETLSEKIKHFHMTISVSG